MGLIGNSIWFVVAGFLGYMFAAVLCFIFIFTIPFGVAAPRIAVSGVWPFGREIVSVDEARRRGLADSVVV